MDGGEGAGDPVSVEIGIFRRNYLVERVLEIQCLWKLAYLQEMTLTKLYLLFLDHTPSLSHAVKMASPGEMIPKSTARTCFLKVL